MFRLCYTSCFEGASKFDSDNHFEVWGSAEAIFNLWLNLSNFDKLASGNIPRHISVRNKDGVFIDMTRGIAGMYSQVENTYK